MNVVEVVLAHIENDWEMFQECKNTDRVDECRQILKKFIADLSVFCSLHRDMTYEKLTVKDVDNLCNIGNEQAIVDLLNDQCVNEGIKSLIPQVNLSEIASYYSVKGKPDTIDGLLARAEGNTFGIMNPPVSSDAQRQEMLNPSAMITGFTSSTNIDGSWGKERLMDLFCHVYMRSAHRFAGMSIEQAKELVQQMTESRDESVFSMIEKDQYNKGIPNGNIVTICEALLWTAMFTTTGVNQQVVLAYIREDTDDEDKVVLIETTQPDEYNAILIAPFADGSYRVDSKTVLQVLSKTVDTYTVGVRSTKG